MRAHGLDLFTTDIGEGPVFDRFFEGYDRAFVLPDEKEDRAGLAECLALNHGAEATALTERFGPFRELCVTAHDSETGLFVGGANFLAMPYETTELGRVVTANLNYVFIAPQARGQGRFRALNAALRDLIAGLFLESGDDSAHAYIFIEQNDPYRMSAEAYARDTEFTGMDQFDRLRIWARQGALVVDFPYVQPALSADQEADDTLVYSVLGAPGSVLPSGLLLHHLRGFFGISVLKGGSAHNAPEALAQIDMLEQMADEGASIALLDPGEALAHVTDVTAALSRDECPSSFRAHVREMVAPSAL